jgi:FHS family L-fucose permease-like MFS transporter
VAFIGLSIASSGVSALLFLLAVGFCNSIMFPTLFTLAIEDLGEGKPQGSGVLCTAIVGGAFIPPAVGAVADSAGFGVAFVLPMLCYLYIAWYSGRLVPQESK